MKFVLRRVNPFSVLRSSKTWQQAFVTWLTWKFIVNYAKITSSEMQSKMGSGHLDKNEEIICVCVARLEDGTYFLFLENSKSFEMGLFWLGFSVFGVTSFFCSYIWISQWLSLLSVLDLKNCVFWFTLPPFPSRSTVVVVSSSSASLKMEIKSLHWNSKPKLKGEAESIVQIKSSQTEWPPHPDPPPQPWPQPRLATFEREVTKEK